MPHFTSFADFVQWCRETRASVNFLPKWGVALAPIGMVVLWFGVSWLHDRRRERWGAALWVCGAILWAYGFAAFLESL